MFAGLKGWFVALSLIKKVGIGVASATTLGVISSSGQPPAKPVNPAIEPASTTEVQAKKVETKVVTEAQAVHFKSTTTNDASIDQDTMLTRTEGSNGVKTLTFEVTYTDGKETGRKLVSEEITTQPVTKVVVRGTKVAAPPPPPPAPRAQAPSSCDPNYSGCVPIASDVDCAGGSGNGPAYVSGPIQVTGTDIYGLDRDGNGTACE